MKNLYPFLLISFLLLSCNPQSDLVELEPISLPTNIINYQGTPTTPNDRNSFMFSDQGAWFAYGFPSEEKKALGFSGPFLMTQGFGEWSSAMLSQLSLVDTETKKEITLDDFSVIQTSYHSHLEQSFKSPDWEILQTLFFSSGHSAIITTEITNRSNQKKSLQPNWTGTLFSTGLKIAKNKNILDLTTNRSTAKGKIQTFGDEVSNISTTDSTYTISTIEFHLKPNESKKIILAQTFIFPQYDQTKEQEALETISKNPSVIFQKRIQEKEKELTALNNKLSKNWQDSIYKDLVAKALLTLQNNTRIPAGALNYAGIFPSYHYKWFLGFWAWDSWKHAVAVAIYNPKLAKNQIRAMYDFQLENGFIVDCVYRDTMIEKHNFRNTKPPLSAWSVWKVYKQDDDQNFVKELYPKILKQHIWWYEFRDFDQDGICEYGSTDGTLKAAKWESGMDNAVRFDNSQMVKNSETVFSLDQESVDLNAYLYVEKLYLAKMAKLLNKEKDAEQFDTQAKKLKTKIQTQFYDPASGWFYDTSIDGKNFIKVMGCEGWIPLWANIATPDQAAAVKENMINPNYFNTKLPFQTLTANHPDFEPKGGYWRGPLWLDQAYFGVKGLKNYGFDEAAQNATYKLIHNTAGVLDKGTPIRENYHPITGEGLESQNFSWSAAHYLMLLM